MTIYHTDTNDIVCPYCGYENGDGYPPTEFEEEIECANCDENFRYVMKVTYSTKKLEEI